MAGYIYFCSNESMEGILRLGGTKRIMEKSLDASLLTDTWCPPTPYKLEYAKEVTDYKEKKRLLIRIVSKHYKRLHEAKNFFRVSIADMKDLFDLIDGSEWCMNFQIVDYVVVPEKKEVIVEQPKCLKAKKKTINMAECFKDGQLIKHTFNNHTWVGAFDRLNNKIVRNDEAYTSLSGFCKAHLVSINCCAGLGSINGWFKCYALEDNTWVMADKLRA